jgi:alkanesulfonate monooxygenase SsuD/methylene tetrahydromethanopterin reductase-like flavin-dependent oxidoreductase (luciferase family)
MRSLWRDGPSAFDGAFYRWKDLESNPKPVQRPGIPIVVGGHVEGAARRAARIGDGFFPARGDFKTLVPLLDALRDECGKTGRNPDEIEISTGAMMPDADTVARYEDLGVSRLVMPPPAFDAKGLLKALPALAEKLIG